MSDGKMNSEEMEPSFNIDDWVKELLPDSDLSGINCSETDSFQVSTSFMDNSMQQNKSINMEENCQVATKISNMKSSMNRNPVNTSGCVFTDGLNNLVGGFSSTSSAYGLAHNQNLSHMIMQVGQHQQLHHQVPAQLVEKPSNYSSSTRLNAYNSSNQMQQQQNISTASAMFQQQRSTGYQSHSHLIMRNQGSFNVIHQADQSNLDPKLQQFSRQVQMQQPVNMQSGLVSEHAQPKLMASAFPQSQSRNFQLANHNKSEKQTQQFQGPPQVQMPIHADWADQAFHQITQLKATCLTEVVANYRKATEQRNQAQNNETLTKFEKMMTAYRQIHSFLQMSKSEIENHGKEKFLKCMKYFGPHLEKIRAKSSLRMQQQAQQIDASFSQLVTPQLRHRGIVPQFYGTLPNLPAPLRQQRHLSLDASPMSSFQVGSSAGVQMLDASSNRHSMMRSTQQHQPSQVPQRMPTSTPHEDSKLGFEQGSPVKQPHSSSGVPRQFTFSAQQQKVTSSRQILNPLESSSGEKNNNPNIGKSVQQSLSMEHMQQIMQKRNSGSPLRHIVGINKSSSSFNIPSPQNSQHSSSLLEFSKSRTPPSLSTSPMTFPSPLNPLTPISKAADSEFNSLSLEESNKVPSASPALVEPPKQNEPVVEGLVSSPLVREPCNPDKADFSHDAQYPMINRLINAVKTMSPADLQSSIRDINAITEMSDIITGSFRHGEHTMDIVNDLAGDVRTHNHWNFASMYETGMESRMKRQLDSIRSMPEMECHASYMVKKPRKGPNDELLQEIKEINKKFMEVVVEARAGNYEETSIVSCSYCPIGLNGNGVPNTSPNMFPYLMFELMVTSDYPRSSPIILESQPPSCSESEEGKEMWMKAMSNFSSEVRILDQPISLRQMAKTWELCARRVYIEFAEKNGGGNFSTTYGKWETLSC